MNVKETSLSGLLLIDPRVFEDERGWFMETFHGPRLAVAGIPSTFVQDNHSFSRRGVLRGLHYQIQHPQGKLIRTVRGDIFDVVVDLRRTSATFGKWHGVRLNETNRRQLFVPGGFAHGFLALSETAEVVYKCTDVYHPEHERTLLWNDPQIGVVWPLSQPPLLSDKDCRGQLLTDAECFGDIPKANSRPTSVIAPPHFPLAAHAKNGAIAH